MRTKARLTITLSQSVLNAVDTLVNGITIRNRSHAIETLLKQSLSPSVKTALILAGGNQDKKPHPSLSKISGGYLLAHTLNMLKKHNINKVIISLHKTDTEIMRIFGKGESYGLQIEYSIEEKHLGTGGAVKKAKSFFKNMPFLVIHGDTLTNMNLSNLCSFHFTEKSLATIAVKPRLGELKYGQVFIQGNKIIKFLETSENSGISIINTGVYVFNQKIFDFFPQKEVFDLEKDVFPSLAKQQQLSASIFQGLWFDITDENSLKKAKNDWNKIQL